MRPTHLLIPCPAFGQFHEPGTGLFHPFLDSLQQFDARCCFRGNLQFTADAQNRQERYQFGLPTRLTIDIGPLVSAKVNDIR